MTTIFYVVETTIETVLVNLTTIFNSISQLRPYQVAMPRRSHNIIRNCSSRILGKLQSVNKVIPNLNFGIKKA
jgi:hypothetical protein